MMITFVPYLDDNDDKDNDNGRARSRTATVLSDEVLAREHKALSIVLPSSGSERIKLLV